MIEMDEQFQAAFGIAMAQLRTLVKGLVGNADNARGEAKMLSANDDSEAAITSYEVAHAYWSAADRVRTVLSLFEDADRRAAALMETPAEPEAAAEDALTNASNIRLHNRIRYLEGQLERLDIALRGRPARLDEKIRETETTEDLVDAAIRAMSAEPWKPRFEKEKERADALASVTLALAPMLGVFQLDQIVPAVEQLLKDDRLDYRKLAEGTLIAGEWISAAGTTRKVYVGRLFRVDPDGPVIEYICDCGQGDDGFHTVSNKLNPETVRLPSADEILAFSTDSENSGLLQLDEDE